MTQTVNNVLDWRSIDTACVDISLHNRYQTGAYLESTLLWVDRRFKNCLINLGDTLHRHNLAWQYDNNKAHRIALEMGDQWLAANARILETMTIPWKLIRSDDWLAEPDFARVYATLIDFYKVDESFQAAVENDISGFVIRNTTLPEAKVRAASLFYLMEEAAADIVLGQKQAVTHLYPGKWHQCYFHLIDHADSIPAELRGLEKCMFKRFSPGKVLQTVSNSERIKAAG